MTTKQILIGIAALVVLGGAYLAFTSQKEQSPVDQPGAGGEEQEAVQTYTSNDLGVSFDYPEDYTLESHNDGNAERSWTTLVLTETSVKEEYENSGAMDGAPSITVQVFDNAENLSVEEWITTTSYSNYKLAVDPELLQGQIGGDPALAYEIDGLYRSNAAVVSHEGRIYMFTVGWLTEEDRNLREFGGILDSVEFI